MTQPGTRSPEVVGRELRYSQPFRVFLDNVPDYFLRNLRSPNNAFTANASENLTVCDPRHVQPVVNGLFYPVGHGNRSDVYSFPDQVNDGPMVLPALDVIQPQ